MFVLTRQRDFVTLHYNVDAGGSPTGFLDDQVAADVRRAAAPRPKHTPVDITKCNETAVKIHRPSRRVRIQDVWRLTNARKYSGILAAMNIGKVNHSSGRITALAKRHQASPTAARTKAAAVSAMPKEWECPLAAAQAPFTTHAKPTMRANADNGGTHKSNAIAVTLQRR